MLQQHRRGPRQATAGEWLRRIARLLESARWGERSDASSVLFQAREAWERMLEQVASLDLFAKEPLPYKKLLEILERTAQETIFAPESEDAPVQVMGAYAASGQSFDAVWFLGATDTAWPAAGRPNPLLPIALQRELGMPHASAAENSALAHHVMARIAESSGAIVYSYAQMSDESVQRPSPLVSSFAPATFAVAAPAPHTISLETVADDTWVPLLNAGLSSGGHTPLKRQAECPFQAFVFQRLAVRELPVAGRGLSPADRGNLFHKVMQGVWSEDIGGYTHLTSHADLLHATAAGTLRPLVAGHTAAAIRWLGAECGDPWQRAYLKAEEERTIDLVMDWLAIEANSPAVPCRSGRRKKQYFCRRACADRPRGPHRRCRGRQAADRLQDRRGLHRKLGWPSSRAAATAALCSVRPRRRSRRRGFRPGAPSKAGL